MKKLLAAALLSAVVAAPAFAADNGPYVGLMAGGTKTDNPYPGTTTTKDTDTVGSIALGYQFDKNWGVEIFYGGTGKLETSFPGGASSGKGDAMGINAVATMPIYDAFSLYAKLGYASIKTDVSSTDPTAIGERHGAGTGGLGGLYNINKDIGIRLGWDAYEASSKVAGIQYKPKTDVWSVGVVVKY